jgi:hypothetical protein
VRNKQRGESSWDENYTAFISADTEAPVHGRLLRWVKLRNTQHERLSSALPPRTDVGLARPNTITRIEGYGTFAFRSTSIGFRFRGSGVRISPSAPALRPANKGFLAVSTSFFSQIPCCALYFLNPLNIRLSRLVPSSPRNTGATPRFSFTLSHAWDSVTKKTTILVVGDQAAAARSGGVARGRVILNG